MKRMFLLVSFLLIILLVNGRELNVVSIVDEIENGLVLESWMLDDSNFSIDSKRVDRNKFDRDSRKFDKRRNFKKERQFKMNKFEHNGVQKIEGKSFVMNYHGDHFKARNLRSHENVKTVIVIVKHDCKMKHKKDNRKYNKR